MGWRRIGRRRVGREKFTEKSSILKNKEIKISEKCEKFKLFYHTFNYF
jgi:hypothetical protein